MLRELKIACAQAEISIAEFARRIGKSRTTVVLVATKRSTSAETTKKIQEFISENLPPAFAPPSAADIPGIWLSTAEYAKIKQMRPESVANKAREGGFTTVKRVGKRWWIHKSEV